MRPLPAVLIALLAFPSRAAENFLRLDTRPDVKVPVLYIKPDNATASVILLPGGAGGFGPLLDGKPSGRIFLVRSRDYFADAGLNVAVSIRVLSLLHQFAAPQWY